MTTITPAEIFQSRSTLVNDPIATGALQTIEECEGNLEDAFEVLIVESGAMGEAKRQGFGTSLEQFAQKFRHAICQEEFQEEIVDGFSRDLLNMLVPIVTAQLTLIGNLPATLAIPVVMFVLKLGFKQYCKPADFGS